MVSAALYFAGNDPGANSAVTITHAPPLAVPRAICKPIRAIEIDEPSLANG